MRTAACIALLPHIYLAERDRHWRERVVAAPDAADPGHPARALIRAEKQWLRERFSDVLAAGGVADADAVAATLLLLHEGAFVVLSAGQDPDAVSDARRAARTVVRAALGSHPVPPTADRP